jgi:hypothetical protein
MCVDLSATPYYLGRIGSATNTVYPWVVSDFGLTDAIESGLVKVPQLVARDGSGALMPAYFNIWAWILPQLTRAEQGTKRGSPRAEAILKYSHTPIAILGGMWNEKRREWESDDDSRPPVFILVCKNRRIARTLHEWIADDTRPPGIPALDIPELRNAPGRLVTIRVEPQRRIYAMPQKVPFAITVPRVLGYSIAVRNRVTVPDWDAVAGLVLDPGAIPPQSELAAMLNQGRPAALTPGGLSRVDLRPYRRDHREQQLCFQMAADLTRHYVAQGRCEAPPHALFPQLLAIIQRYIKEKVDPLPPTQRIDAFLSYYGWILERLLAAISPDTAAGEEPEIPDLDRHRPCATADISLFTAKRVREAVRSHVNLVVIDRFGKRRRPTCSTAIRLLTRTSRTTG